MSGFIYKSLANLSKKTIAMRKRIFEREVSVVECVMKKTILILGEENNI